jgi:hypothetical protein
VGVDAHHDVRHDTRAQARAEGAVRRDDGARKAGDAKPLEAAAPLEARARAYDDRDVPGPERHLGELEDGADDARAVALGIGEPDGRHTLERRRLKCAGYLSSQLHPSSPCRRSRELLGLLAS